MRKPRRKPIVRPSNYITTFIKKKITKPYKDRKLSMITTLYKINVKIIIHIIYSSRKGSFSTRFVLHPPGQETWLWKICTHSIRVRIIYTHYTYPYDWENTPKNRCSALATADSARGGTGFNVYTYSHRRRTPTARAAASQRWLLAGTHNALSAQG